VTRTSASASQRRGSFTSSQWPSPRLVFSFQPQVNNSPAAPTASDWRLPLQSGAQAPPWPSARRATPHRASTGDGVGSFHSSLPDGAHAWPSWPSSPAPQEKTTEGCRAGEESGMCSLRQNGVQEQVVGDEAWLLLNDYLRG
jgi:hypothetical protein